MADKANGAGETAEKPKKAPARKPGPKPRSIGRPAGQRRIGKEFLIEKTVNLLRTVPPEKLSLSMAARNAGVHLTLIKYYFRDRTRLLVDVARWLAVSLGEGVRAIESRELSAPERLRIRIDTMVDFFFVNPYYHRLMMEILADDNDPLAAELISLWMTKTLDIYRDIIDSGVQEGLLRPIDPHFTFVAVMGLCEQYQHASRLMEQPAAAAGSRKRLDIAAEYKGYVYDLMLHGLGVKKPGSDDGRNAGA
jgi:AcrR family transcriptional regulator